MATVDKVFVKSSHRRCSVRKGALRNFAKFTGKHLCQSLFFKKETLAHVFSCEVCKISKNNFFTEYLWTIASIFVETRLKLGSLQGIEETVIYRGGSYNKNNSLSNC